MEQWTRFVIPSAAAIAAGTVILVLGGVVEFPVIVTVSISAAASVGAGALRLQSQSRRAYRLALERRRHEMTSEDVLRHAIIGDARRI